MAGAPCKTHRPASESGRSAFYEASRTCTWWAPALFAAATPPRTRRRPRPLPAAAAAATSAAKAHGPTRRRTMKNWQHLRFDPLLFPQLQVLNFIAEGLQLAADACGGFCGGRLWQGPNAAGDGQKPRTCIDRRCKYVLQCVCLRLKSRKLKRQRLLLARTTCEQLPAAERPRAAPAAPHLHLGHGIKGVQRSAPGVRHCLSQLPMSRCIKFEATLLRTLQRMQQQREGGRVHVVLRRVTTKILTFAKVTVTRF